MAITKIHPIKSTLKKALDYITNPAKTDGKVLVSSYGCGIETADIEFEKTRQWAMNKGNNLAHHLIQAFEPGEVDYEKAHAISKQLADEILGGKYEYIISTHIDKGHVHNHIIFCAVDFAEHKRLLAVLGRISLLAVHFQELPHGSLQGCTADLGCLDRQSHCFLCHLFLQNIPHFADLQDCR